MQVTRKRTFTVCSVFVQKRVLRPNISYPVSQKLWIVLNQLQLMSSMNLKDISLFGSLLTIQCSFNEVFLCSFT